MQKRSGFKKKVLQIIQPPAPEGQNLFNQHIKAIDGLGGVKQTTLANNKTNPFVLPHWGNKSLDSLGLILFGPSGACITEAIHISAPEGQNLFNQHIKAIDGLGGVKQTKLANNKTNPFVLPRRSKTIPRSFVLNLFGPSEACITKAIHPPAQEGLNILNKQPSDTCC